MERRPFSLLPVFVLVFIASLACLLVVDRLLERSSARADGADDADTAGVALAARDRSATSTAAKDAGTPAPITPLDAVRDDDGIYLADEVMVRVARGASLRAVADDHGVHVARSVGASGWGALWIPDSTSRGAFVAELRDNPAVVDAAPIGRIAGAAKGGWKAVETLDEAEPAAVPGDGAVATQDLVALQWHLDVIEAPTQPTAGLSAITVAVLDTGLAYDADDGLAGAARVALPSLAGSPIVAPYDFVDDDPYPLDEHQHGSHIASLIAADGVVEGVAPGAALMPIRVLDANNQGTELALLDGIAHAVDHGADVINMSLSFSEGYHPSRALAAVLEDAWAAGVVLVGAAGNEGAAYAAYPGAHPRVISVTALAHDSKKGKTTYFGVAGYANQHPRVDLIAPGGDVGGDVDGDGIVDGILGETIALQDPSTLQYTLYAGTSQATALVSGAAAQLLAAGVHPHGVLDVLHRSADVNSPWSGYLTGAGSGGLNLEAALASVADDDALPPDETTYHLAIMPWLIGWTGQLQAAAQVTLLDDAGHPVPGATVHASLSGASDHALWCDTDAAGQCDLWGGSVWHDYDNDDGKGWLLDAPTALLDGRVIHPRPAFFAPDGLEILLAAAAEHPELDGALLAFRFPEGHTVAGGYDSTESYLLIDTGTGLGSSPLGIALTPRVLDGVAQARTYSLDLDGTGLGSSPLGTVLLTRLWLDGSGLGASPLGLTSLKLLVLDGDGLGASPLGLQATQVYSTAPPAYDSDFLALDGAPVLLGRSYATSADLDATVVAELLSSGGWVTDTGHGAAQSLHGAGLVDLQAPALGTPGAGAGAVPYASIVSGN